MADVKEMSSIVHNEYGAPEKVIEFIEGKHPVPGLPLDAHSVLIKVVAASMNPVDWKILVGHLKLIDRKEFPAVPGYDGAGIVVAVGAECKRIKVGDEIWADNRGGFYGQYVAVKEEFVSIKPKNMTFREAASMPVIGLSAIQGIVQNGGLQSGGKLLVLGGTTSTGMVGIQVGKAVGATVACTCGGSSVDLVKGLGADQTFDYKTQDWGTDLKGQDYDVIYDTVGGIESWNKAHDVLKKGGVYVTLVGDGSGELTAGRLVGIIGSQINRGFWGALGGPKYKQFLASPSASDMDTLRTWVEAGKVRAVVEKSYPFTKEGCIDMFKTSMGGRCKGKLILDVAPVATEDNKDSKTQ